MNNREWVPCWLRALGQIKGRDHPRRRDAFHALRGQHRGHEAVLVRDGEDLRELPLIERKRRLARLVRKTKNWLAIQYGEHLKGDGWSVFLPTSAGWGWKASSQSGRTRRIEVAHPRRGSSRRAGGRRVFLDMPRQRHLQRRIELVAARGRDYPYRGPSHGYLVNQRHPEDRGADVVIFEFYDDEELADEG